MIRVLKEKGKRLALNLIGIGVFLAIWQAAAMALNNPAVPTLDKIFTAFEPMAKSSNMYENIFATLKLVVIGVAIAFALGFIVGVMCEASKIIDGLTAPIIEGARNVAAITLFPLFIVLFGIGDFPRILVIFWTAFPAILLSTIQGLKSTDDSILEAALDLGANKAIMYMKVKIPLALPQILNGLRIGIGNGFIAIVVAEMLGASKGLGFMVLWTTQSFKYAQTYTYIAIIAVVGGLINFIMNIFIKKIERRFNIK